MKGRRWIWGAALLLLAGVLALRLLRPAPAAPRLVLPDVLPEPPPAPPDPPSLPPVPPVPAGPVSSPERLIPYLERLGRARLLRDRRGLAVQRAAAPELSTEDAAWLRGRLGEGLFVAAGAAELARLRGLRAIIPELGRALTGASHPFLKGVVIETLAAFGGDAAVVPLLAALAGDPDPGVRSRCAKALDGFGGPEAYYALMTALRDPAPQVRVEAAEALRRRKSPDLVRLLVDAIAREPEPAAAAELAVAAYHANGGRWDERVREAVRGNEAAVVELLRRVRLGEEERYADRYDAAFFRAGGVPVPWDGSGPRIGITVELSGRISLAEVAGAIFSYAPFDRYREWFYFRRADDFPEPRAYDTYGRSMGSVAWNERDGTVYLRFRDPDHFERGVLGYTRGCEATVTALSIPHEVGHALATLADEYPGGSRRRAANLATERPVPWTALVRSGVVPDPPLSRGEGFWVPTDSCHMNNRLAAPGYCPVCQLGILARISELTGLDPPW